MDQEQNCLGRSFKPQKEVPFHIILNWIAELIDPGSCGGSLCEQAQKIKFKNMKE